VGEAAILFIRPEALRLDATPATRDGNSCAAQAVDHAYEGNMTHLSCRGHDGTALMVLLGAGDRIVPPAPGTALTLGFAAEDAVVLPPDR
jgi:hypothetical protein